MPPDITTPVRYPASDILRSGWLLGADLIAGKAAVVDVPVGDGNVVLLGTSVQHRAQAHGSFQVAVQRDAARRRALTTR